MNVTQADIARATGFSISTVSRVLAGGKTAQRIGAKTRATIEDAARQMGYQHNAVAQSLRTGKSWTMAMLESDIANPWFAMLTSLIEQKLYEHGYLMLLCNSMEDREREAKYLTLLRRGAIGGLILVPLLNDRSSLKRLVGENLPLVVMDRPIEGVDACVSSELEQPAHLLCDNLHKAGVRKVALIQGPEHVLTHRKRAEVVASHFPILDRCVGPATRETGVAAMQRWAGHELTAVICTNVSLALGAIDMISMDNPPVIGCFDAVPSMDILPIPIACTVQNIPALAEGCVTLLLSQVMSPQTPIRPIVLPAYPKNNRRFDSLLAAHLATGTD